MKHLKIETEQYNVLLGEFARWLTIKKKSNSVIDKYPILLREFFHYMENKLKVKDVRKIEHKHSEAFKEYIINRMSRNKRTGLSISSINYILKTKNSFIDFLAEATTLRMLHDKKYRMLHLEEIENEVLSKEQVQELYDVTFENYGYYTHCSVELGQRDRVIIGLLYGCGLRNAEARALNLNDIDLVNKKILVRHGKYSKQRYVPIPNKTLEDLKDFIQNGRYYFLYSHKNQMERIHAYKKIQVDEEALLLNFQGKRLSDLNKRLKTLLSLTTINLNVTPHMLRHSLGTHLYQSGMPINDLKIILGHGTIDTTQRYVRISKRLELETNKTNEHE